MGVNVHDLLMGQQRELLAQLDNDRKLLPHPTEKGDATELNWSGVIKQFLPDRYQVQRASVLDADGGRSDVIDVVVFDRQYCPLWFKRGDSHYVPAESVYAVLEVKQNLDAGNVKYARDKAASVRRLHRTNRPIVHAGGTYLDPKPPFEIVAGILTLTSDWSPPFGPSFESAVTAGTPEDQIDIGCALRHGSFDIKRDPDGDVAIIRSEPEAALMFFLMRLFSRLQRMGTVPAIDMAAYARALEDRRE
jgi:hypothetical protein